MSEKMREEFEARYPLAPGCVFHEGKYGFWIVWDESGEPEFSTGTGLAQLKWESRQASRETLVIELPKPDSDDGDSWDQCFKSGVSQCRAAIHAVGVKTK